ncbi:MAG: hypothetical protein HWE39_07285, partial [Oceanospirillaceae bacterium]|nr:hypothetical protein [Oceanospirillaceae bacterium]
MAGSTALIQNLDPENVRSQHQAHLFRYGLDPGVFALGYLAWVLVLLGEPGPGGGG